MICFQRNPMPFLLDYKSALIKWEWISCDDISWLTQILMERIKWVWLIDSQAAKQSHHQSLLTHLLTRSLTRSIHQSINESMDGSRDTLHPLNITFVTARKLTGGFVCVLSEMQCYLLIYSFWFDTAASYRHISVLYGIVDPKKYQVYILFTKLAPISPSELRFNSKATFSFECIISFLLLFYHTLTCRCLPCPVVSTCLLLADD